MQGGYWLSGVGFRKTPRTVGSSTRAD